jgi:cytochrome d ubiquinol oxidase subunit I
MDSTVLIHRLQFAFTITFHYLFPQLTMGLALLIVIFKTIALRTGKGLYNDAARFWGRIFGISFLFGVVTGIPMEFQFGTNWARFSRLTGGVIGSTLVMEGVFAFFLESAFLGLFLYGEKRLSPIAHWWAGFLVFVGSWLSAYFIVATNAWMQDPVAFKRLPDGSYQLTSFWQLLSSPWALLQYVHTMGGAVITGALVVAGVGAYYLLQRERIEHGRLFVRVAVVVSLIVCNLQMFPSGDAMARYVAKRQPVTTAAMEGLFDTRAGAPVVILGQPDQQHQRIDNALVANDALSFLLYGTTAGEVRGLNAFPRENWPTDVPLLYYSYHIMVGLGTIFAAVMTVAALLLWRRRLYDARWMLWLMLLCAPLAFVANTAGWIAAETGRQPWLVYGLMRVTAGYSERVREGNGLFTLLGFMGLYTLLAMLFLFLVQHEIAAGPRAPTRGPAGRQPAAAA